MSYMRSPHYVYVIRVALDDDDMKTTETDYLSIDMTIQMEMSVFDELVVMRMAELSEDEVKQAAERAAKNHGGNVGCIELTRQMGLPGFYERLQDSHGVR